MRSPKLLLVAIAAAFAGCADGTNDAAISFEPEPASSFTSVVKDMFAVTADNTESVEVDQIPIGFNDLENPAAFDDLLQ